MEGDKIMHLAWLQDAYGLTRKELEVVNLVLMAKSSKQIAMDLHIHVPTVEVHRAHIRRKMGVNNTAGVFRRVMAGPSAEPADGSDKADGASRSLDGGRAPNCLAEPN